MEALLAYVAFGLRVLPLIVRAGEDIGPIVESLAARLTAGGDPSAEDWATLHQTENRLRAQLNAPIPAIPAV